MTVWDAVNLLIVA